MRDPTLVPRALGLGLTGENFLNTSWREVFEYVMGRDEPGVRGMDWSGLSPETRGQVTALLDDVVDLANPEQVFDAAVRRLLFRKHRERLSEIDRELTLADAEQQRRLLVEKQELAAQLREAGEAGAFMPRGRVTQPMSDRTGPIPVAPDEI